MKNALCIILASFGLTLGVITALCIRFRILLAIALMVAVGVTTPVGTSVLMIMWLCAIALGKFISLVIASVCLTTFSAWLAIKLG